jgi:hypothetical protein
MRIGCLIKNISMKTNSYFNGIKFIIVALLFFSCSGSDDSDSENDVNYGTIQLTGADTASLGNALIVANISPNAYSTTGTSSSVILLDKNTKIEDGELVSTDYANGFVIVATQFNAEDNAATDKAISMTIIKDGVDFSYVCTTPPTSTIDNTDCGANFSVNKTEKIITFNATTVINVDSGTILTMTGTINYN